MDTEKPTHTNWWWGEVTKDVARLYIQVTDNIGINRVQCPTSTASGSYNNWHWFNAVWDSSANAYRCDITPSTFGHYNQTYITHLYIYDHAGNGGYYNQTSAAIPASTSVITYVIGGTSTTKEVANGALVSDYVPTVSSGTFIGWTTNSSSTTAETIYATGNMTVYGITKVTKTVSSSVLNWSNMSTTLSGSWPDNATISGYVSGYHNDEAGSGHLRLYCDGQELAGRDISAGQTQSASGALNLGTKKSVTLTLSSNQDNTNISARASVSWTELVTG